MATGIPRRAKSPGRLGVPKPRFEATSTLSLSYPGKRSTAEILATPPAAVTVVWRPPRDDRGPLNRLYFGDNLAILAALLRDRDVAGKVRLVYIDPPFATGMLYQSRALAPAYEDPVAGPGYIEFLRERLVLLRELLADDGSIYLHLDDKMAFHAKVIMDEVFGAANYRNWITRKKCNPKNYTRNTYGNVADFILFYTKSDDYVWARPTLPWTPEQIAKEYPCVEQKTGRRYKKVPVHAPGVRNGATGAMWRGRLPPRGKHWQFVPSTLDEMDRRGEIYWSPTGNPRRKVYLDDSPGLSVQDIWLDCRDAHNQNIRITGYPTEKNPEMMARIIRASSKPGDLVLDCFSGSGTTLAVAASLGRRWIGIDNSPLAITTTLGRFAEGPQPMGDFVERGAARQPKVKQHNLALLDGSEMSPGLVSGTMRQSEILDFWLYSSEPLPPELTRAAHDWAARIGSRSQVSESGIPYGRKRRPSAKGRASKSAKGR